MLGQLSGITDFTVGSKSMSIDRKDQIKLREGDHVGQFHVVKVLQYGRGGMAQVCLSQNRLGKHVALKIAVEERFNDPIDREAELLQRLRHPGIVRIEPLDPEKKNIYVGFATKLRGQPHYFIMEYLEGSSLENYLNQHKRLEISEAAEIISQLAQTLIYCHNSKPDPVVHLDVKPDNIIFRHRYPTAEHPRPEVVLVDFGIGKRKGQKVIPAGALPYMAPEWVQAIKSQDAHAMDQVDHQADVYSLGAVLYQVLTGRPPFMVKSNTTTTDILKRQPDPPSRYNPKLRDSPDLDDLILRLLNKSPQERPSLEEVSQFLNRLRGHPPRPPRLSSVPWGIFLAIVVPVAVVVGLGVSNWGTIREYLWPSPPTPLATIQVPTSMPPLTLTAMATSRPPTVTAVPTPKATDTPTPMPTLVPTATPASKPVPTTTDTQSAGYSVPLLVAPLNGKEIYETKYGIELSWQSVGSLAADEFYDVYLTWRAAGKQVAQHWYTQETHFVIPQEYFGRSDDGRYEWNVVVRRGQRPEAEKLSNISQQRFFLWQRSQPVSPLPCVKTIPPCKGGGSPIQVPCDDPRPCY
jgi:serine/threonine-protein kinase